jgi:hypothetical protein
MDFIYLLIALVLWLTIWGMAMGCARLQSRGGGS